MAKSSQPHARRNPHRMARVMCERAGDFVWANAAPGNYTKGAAPQPYRMRCTRCGSTTHSQEW